MIRQTAGDLYVEIPWHGIVALVPCRRVNRATDPVGVYVGEDGSVYRSMVPADAHIWAQVVQPSHTPASVP